MSLIRYSRQREAILSYLKSSTEHPTAEMVYEKIKQEISNLSLGTVYRNLAFLVEIGEIIRIKSQDDIYHFDARIIDHYHWQCRKCGKVEDLNMQVELELNEKAGKAAGVKIDNHELCFFGICDECYKSKK